LGSIKSHMEVTKDKSIGSIDINEIMNKTPGA